MISPVSFPRTTFSSRQAASTARRPASPAPQFGNAGAVIGLTVSSLMLASTLGTAIELIILQRRWDRELNGIKDQYGELPANGRETFLNSLAKAPGFEKNPFLSGWQKMTLRAERARQVRAAEEELYVQQGVLWTYDTMDGIFSFLRDLKKKTVETPDTFQFAPVVHAWASYMETTHMVTKAYKERAISKDQEHDWYAKLDKKWTKTPILLRPSLTPGFENVTHDLEGLIKTRMANRTPAELQRIYSGILAELEGDPEFNQRMDRAVQAHEAEYDDVAFQPLEDVSDLPPSFDEAELRRREEQRLLARFREEMDTLTADDFRDQAK